MAAPRIGTQTHKVDWTYIDEHRKERAVTNCGKRFSTQDTSLAEDPSCKTCLKRS